jgi:F420-dependent oxidoreductase-like protein
MIAISIMIEGQQGLTWPRWQRLAAEVESLGFAGLFRSDHFTDAEPPSRASLETVVSLGYLATATSRVHFGPLVAPVSFRDPVMLARQAAAIDDLSGGRLILGLGAGWQEREHALFGYELGDVPTRMARFEEALEVTTRLLRHEAPAPFAGRFYQLREGAALLPRPQRPGGPQLMIGGNGPKRTLPLAARYADVWNAAGLHPDVFRERSATLDRLLSEAGRARADVRRTLMVGSLFAADEASFERELRRAAPRELAGLPHDELLARAQRQWYGLRGTPEMVRGQVAECAAAGVEELMVQWLDMDDIEGLRALAASVLPLASGA